MSNIELEQKRGYKLNNNKFDNTGGGHKTNLIFKSIETFVKYVIFILFLLIIMWLILVAGFSTSYINISTEYTYYVADSMFWNMASCTIPIGLAFIIRKNKKIMLLYSVTKNAKTIFLLCIGVVGALIVLCCHTIPRSDQIEIIKAAQGLKQNDFTMFKVGGYLQMCQNQSGIVVFIYFLSIFFGENNYIVFQLLNVAALVLIYKELSEIANCAGMNKICQLAVLFFGIFFLPLTLYTTFVYGTLISLAFALKAVKYELLFFENWKWRNLLFAAFLIAFSVMIKSNSLIFMIAMIIYAFLKIVGKHWKRVLLLLITILLFQWIQGIVVNSFLAYKIGQPMQSGISSWAYIAMGLQEGNRADGWWNKYNSTSYLENDCDTDKQAKEAKQYIQERLDYFVYDWRYAVQFMGHKLASQWNNPTFQCFWVVNKQQSNIEQPEWIKRMYSVRGQNFFSKILNLLQFMVLMGSLLFCVFDTSRIKNGWIMLQTIFVGGFLFHIFWEAKCQYTLPYFMLLVPLAVKGYSNICRIVEYTIQKIGKKEYMNQTFVFSLLILGIIVFVQCSSSVIIERMVKIADNMEEYIQYVQFNTTDKIADGIYRICPYENDKVSIACLDLENKKNSEIALMSNQKNQLEIKTINDRVYLRFYNSELYLDLRNNKEIENGPIQAHQKNNTDAQKWVLKKASSHQDAYYILIGTQSALSYDSEGKVCIKKFDGSDTQKWRLIHYNLFHDIE